MEYVGRLACICGTMEERKRGRDYIKVRDRLESLDLLGSV